MENETLISHRVKQEENLSYKALEMEQEEILERRSLMRKLLKGSQFESCSQEELDNMRITRLEKGILVESAQGVEFYLRSNEITKGEADFRRIRSMMPFEFLNLTGKDFDWSKYQADIRQEKDMVSKYIMRFRQFQEKGMGLYIYSGTKGSGKTMLSCCILNELMRRYAGSVKFINTLDYLEVTKQGYRGEEKEKDALYQASVLVIDDIGVQMSREWIETEFYRLINDRYVNRRPTIYTSNVPIERLRMDDRVTDRIESTTYLIGLPEESIRRKERQLAKQELLKEIENAPG